MSNSKRDPPKGPKRKLRRRSNFRCSDVRLFRKVCTATAMAALSLQLTRAAVAVFDYLNGEWQSPKGEARRYCDPSLTAIAKAKGIDRDTVIEAVKALESRGLIHVRRRKEFDTGVINARNQYMPVWDLVRLEAEHKAALKVERNVAQVRRGRIEHESALQRRETAASATPKTPSRGKAKAGPTPTPLDDARNAILVRMYKVLMAAPRMPTLTFYNLATADLAKLGAFVDELEICGAPDQKTVDDMAENAGLTR